MSKTFKVFKSPAFKKNKFLKKFVKEVYYDQVRSLLGGNDKSVYSKPTKITVVYTLTKEIKNLFSRLSLNNQDLLIGEICSSGMSQLGATNFLKGGKLPKLDQDLHVVNSNIYHPILSEEWVTTESEIYCQLLEVRKHMTPGDMIGEFRANLTY
jgi:hypothetical protein